MGSISQSATAASACLWRCRRSIDEAFTSAGAPDNDPHTNGIGLGMAAPTILAYAVGSHLGESGWRTVTEREVDLFVDATGGDE